MDLIYDVNLPRLLDANMNEARRVNVLNASVNLSITPLSTAYLELPIEENIPERAYVEIFTCNGSVGIFRARAPESVYGGSGNSVQLEHGVCEIGDYIIKDSVTFDGPADTVFAEIFSHYGGSLWQLGTITPTENIKFTSDHGNVLQTLCEALSMLPGYMMTFNQAATPWTLNIIPRPTTVSAEGRLSRNVTNAAITRDDSELCTRVYMKDLPEPGYMDADTISTYGIVERYISTGLEEETEEEETNGETQSSETQGEETQEDDTTAQDAAAIAELYLEKRKNPLFTITIDAQDLYQITGEPLDQLEIGKLYRLALPDYNVTQEKTITAMEWPDVYENPGHATITLADEIDSLTAIMSGIQLELRTVEKQIVKVSDDTRNSIIKAEGDLYSVLERTASYLRSEFYDTANGLYSRIEQTASHIRTEVGDIRNDIYSSIEQTASSIRAEVHAQASSLYSSLEITATQIRSEVGDSINGVYSSITETASSIRAEVHNAESSLYSALEITQTQIRSEVGDSINGVYSSITETASQIRAEVHNAESSLYSAITSTATQIRAEVADTTNSLHSAIEVNADNIALKVSKGDVATQLAIEAGNVTISGGNLVVDGYVTANQLQSEIADLESAWADVIVTEEVSANTILADVGVYTPLLSVSGTSYTGHTISITNVSSGTYLGTQDLTLDHYHAITATESNGVITLTPGAAQATAPAAATFNIADTQYYKDAVASARQAGVQSVTIEQSGIMIDPDDYAQYDSTNIRYRVPVYAEISNGHGVTKDIYISAQAAYNAGAASVSQRSASSLSNLTLFASHTGTASRNVKVTYDTGDYVSLPIQIDASAVYAAGQNSVTPRTVSSLSKITLSSSEIGSNVSKTTTAQFSSGSDQSGITIRVDASAVYNQGSADGWAVGVDAKTPVSLEVTSSTSVSVGGSSIIVSNIKAKGNMGTFYDTDGLSLDINSKFSRIGTARGGLSNYGYTKLYRENLGSYIPVGEHYWYYSDSNQNLRTLLEPV